ncbi:MAG: hypothetical protein N2657_04875 [bacterium]|nr:hypothetical protein [bacterium]
MSSRKGILLISTLFFVVVLIMMSIALFGLTRTNYQVNREYFANQKSITNAENAIQIMMFLIQHNPNAFEIRDNQVWFPLDDQHNLLPQIRKVLTDQNFMRNLPYFYIFVDLSNNEIIQHNYITNLPRISIDERAEKKMYAVIFVPKNKDISEEGVVLFFGNHLHPENITRKDNANLAFYRINGRGNVTFYISSVPNNNAFPVYSSLNNGNSDVEINKISPQSSRQIKKYYLSLFVTSYSLVPGTLRYKVNYIEQHFLRSSMIQANLLNTGTTNIRATKLNIISDYFESNKFISKKYEYLSLESTKFNSPTSSTIKGKLISKDTNNAGLNFQGQDYSFEQILSSPDLYNQVKNTIQADLQTTQNIGDTKKLRDFIVNKIRQQSYVSLPPGWYVFKDGNKLVYFPSYYTYDQVKNRIGNVNKKAKKLNELTSNRPVIIENRLMDSSGENVVFEIKDYNLKISTNIKVDGSFIHITSFGDSYFGNRDIRMELNGTTFFAENSAIVVDGMIKGVGSLVATGDGSFSGHRAMNYYDLNLNSYWSPYSSSDPAHPVYRGDVIARFDQLRSPNSNVAIIADNNFIVNPLSSQDNIDFFDKLILSKLIKYASDPYYNNSVNNWQLEDDPQVVNSTTFNSTTTFFQLILDNPENIDQLFVHGGKLKSKDPALSNYIIKISSSQISSSQSGNQSQSSMLVDPRIFSSSPLYSNNNPNNIFDRIVSYTTSSDLLMNKSISISSSGINISDNPNNTTRIPTDSLPFLSALGSETYDFSGAECISYWNDNIAFLIVGYGSSSSTAGLHVFVFEKPANQGSWIKVFDRRINANISPDNVKGVFDDIDSIDSDNDITLEKLAIILEAAMKNDGNLLNCWEGVDKRNEGKIRERGTSIIGNRLKGLYSDYYKMLAENGLSSRAGNYKELFIKEKVNENYFPFLMVKGGIQAGEKARDLLGRNGLTINQDSDLVGFSNLVVDKYEFASLYLSKPSDVKLEGLIWVGKNFKAVTGRRNNLLLKGAIIVGRDENAMLSIKGVNNTSFIFDTDIIDMLENAAAPSIMIPVFYKQYDKIYTR